MGAVRWNCKASSNRPAISTSHTAVFPTPMKTCRPSPCSKWASCPTRQTMAASMARRIGCASIWRGAAAILRFAPQIRAAAGVLPGPSRRFACLARSGGGAPPGRGRSRSHLARDCRTRWHALRRARSHRRGSCRSTSRAAAGAARAGMGLGRQDAGDGDGAGPLRATGSLPRCSWTPAASMGDKPTPADTLID